MSSKPPFGKIEFNFSPESAGTQAQRDPEAPFRLALLGDFSGRASRGQIEPIGERRVWPIDCDNFEQVLSRLNATVRLPAPWEPAELLELRVASLEDFHPDRILAQVPPLGLLLEKRQQLLNPSTAAAAAAELQMLLCLRPETEPTTVAPAPDSGQTPGPESHEATMARLLGGQPPVAPVSSPAAAGRGHDIQQLIRSIVAPAVVPTASAEHTAILSTLDLELAHQLRAILHHPTWQALEALWRGADLWVRQFGGDEQVQLCLIDVSLEELDADLQATEELARSGICRLLRGQSSDTPWALLVGHYTFHAKIGQLQTLGRLGKISGLLGAPFLSGAAPALVGCDSFDAHPDPDDWTRPMPAEVRETWEALRELPEASCLGLALPRYLVRQPYGSQSDPINAFPFEELPPGAGHEAYLWGNPALLCGCVLADAFQAEGWEMQAAGSGEVSDLPVHKFKDEGGTKVKPCAEAWLSERAGDVISDHGVIPLLSVKGRDAVRVANVRSIARTSASLHGRWG